MSNLIALVVVDQEHRVDSRLIAEQLGVKHISVRKLIDQYLPDFEEFGKARFEIEASGKTNQQQKFYLLNEDQAYLLLAYSQNTEQARDLKKRLVRAFGEQRRLLAAPAHIQQVPVLSQHLLESSLVLDFQGVPIRLLIDESGSWMAAYRDVATALGYVNKEQQRSARNMLLYTAKPADRQLRHPVYGDLIALSGIDRIVASLKRNAASEPDRASRAGSFMAWLATVAYPLVANPASAGLLLSQRWTPPTVLALERDPDYEQTSRILKLWHQDLGESAYRAADVLASATADFAAALADVASGRWFSAVLSAKRLGKWLAVRQGQAVDGLKIECAVERNQKIKFWAVRESA